MVLQNAEKDAVAENGGASQTDVPLSGLFFGLDFALIFCSVVLSLIYDIYACIFSLT
jgi:hypothetical protein